MGTQQILLIVLSVIVVGAAIAVGIQMFNTQSYSSNKSALAADAQFYGTMVIQYYKTPLSLGGAGNDLMRNGIDVTEASNNVGSFIGWGTDNVYYNNEDNEVVNQNGKFILNVIDKDTVTITGIGNEVRNDKSPMVISTIEFPEGKITAVLNDVDVE